MHNIPAFSEMLHERRRQLGLSITQASKVLRLKEQVLIAFEEGDFHNIPKSGYALGMLSSYARYLGLDAKVIVSQYQKDLSQWEMMQSSRQLSSRYSREERMSTSADNTLYDLPNTTVSRQRSLSTGLTSSFAPLQDFERDDRDAGIQTSSARSYPQGHPYTSRLPESRQQQQSRASSRSRRNAQDDRVSGRAQRQNSTYLTSRRISTRTSHSDEYVDDLHYELANPYEAANTRAGRRSSRNISKRERPNVRRQNAREAGFTRRRPASSNSGIIGAVQDFFATDARRLAAVLIGLALILTLVVIFSVSSCVSGQVDPVRTVSVASETSEESTTSVETADSEQKETKTTKTSGDEGTVTKDEVPTKTEVEVSVASDKVTWVEIINGGKSVVAKTVTGPWSEKFTVTESITVQVGDPTAVSVLKNGEKVPFESKVSGVGTLTIQGTKVDSAKSDTAEAATAGGQTEKAATTNDETQAGQADQTTTTSAQ